MRRVLLGVLFLPLLFPVASADPTVFAPAPGAGLAVWSFAEPGDYAVDNVTLGASASLTWRAGSVGDTTGADFAAAAVLANVDVSTSPGDVAILNASGGNPVTETYTPTPSQLRDTYLWSGMGGDSNFGASEDLFVGYWGSNEWNRAVLLFPTVPVPANATVLGIGLRLFLHSADTPDAMEIGVYRVSQMWSETGATWRERDTGIPWNSDGGDFDPSVVDAVANVTTITGWYEWNVTSLALGWSNGTIPNDGLLVGQVDDDVGNVRGRKQFYSSDSGNVPFRPTLAITYVPAGTGSGVLESRVLDAGGTAEWRGIGWTATTPPGASVSVQIRTGPAAAPDGTWTPWSAPAGYPGAPVGTPPNRYLQYRVTLATAAGTSPILHDATASFERHAGTGSLTTEPFRPGNLTRWGRLAADWTGPPSASVLAEYSQDGGASWIPAALDADLAASPEALVLRIRLLTANTTETPRVYDVTLAFVSSTANPPGGGWLDLRVAGIPVWLLLVPFVVLLAWTIVRPLFREPFAAEGIYLIHKDGRLIHRIGGERTIVKDEDAISGMFTIVWQFVKDSFRSGGDGDGELKNFRLDDKDIAVANGEFLYLAVVVEGTQPAEFARTASWFLRGLEAHHAADLQDWDGLSDHIGDIPRDLAWFLRSGYRRRILWPRAGYACR